MLKYSINGYLYCNNPEQLEVVAGKTTRWYIAAVGTEVRRWTNLDVCLVRCQM